MYKCSLFSTSSDRHQFYHSHFYRWENWGSQKWGLLWVGARAVTQNTGVSPRQCPLFWPDNEGVPKFFSSGWSEDTWAVGFWVLESPSEAWYPLNTTPALGFPIWYGHSLNKGFQDRQPSPLPVTWYLASVLEWILQVVMGSVSSVNPSSCPLLLRPHGDCSNNIFEVSLCSASPLPPLPHSPRQNF